MIQRVHQCFLDLRHEHGKITVHLPLIAEELVRSHPHEDEARPIKFQGPPFPRRGQEDGARRLFREAVKVEGTPERDVGRVSQTSGNEQRVGEHPIYRALCLILSGRYDRVPWPTFAPTDWERLGQRASLEGVAPLLLRSLTAAGWPAGSQILRPSLSKARYTTLATNLLIYRELERILAALNDIPVVLLKGTALAATLYPDVGRRPLGDLDLLVPHDGLAEAVARLRTMGYHEPYPEIAPGLDRLLGHAVALHGGEDVHLCVELHWTLVGGEHHHHPPSMSWFWSQTEPLTPSPALPQCWGRAGVGVRVTLTPTAHLLHLAAHLMLQHGGAQARLLWFYDLDLLIRRQAGRVDWEELLRRAREFHWAAALHAALQGARDRLGTPLPPGLLDALAGADDPRTLRLVRRKAHPLQTRATQTWNTISSLEWRAGLRLALAIAFPSPAYVRWRYRMGRLWPLCYPYRWLDIVCEILSTTRTLIHRGQ